MSSYLRHFTAVGDDYENITNWQEDEAQEDCAVPDQTTGQSPEPVSFRDSLRKLFSSNKFQV